METVTSDWERLERKRSHDVIEKVTSVSDGTLFSPTSSEAKCKALPFYREFLIYRVTNYATLPSFSLDFIGDGESFYLLDGSPDPILMANNRGALHLTAHNILDYVDFFLRYITTEEGDIYLIKDSDNLPFLDALSFDQQIALKQRFRPIDVHYNPEDDSYMIRADIYFGGTLLSSNISVSAEGTLVFSDQSMLSQAQDQDQNGAQDQSHYE